MMYYINAIFFLKCSNRVNKNCHEFEFDDRGNRNIIFSVFEFRKRINHRQRNKRRQKVRITSVKAIVEKSENI